MAWNCATTEQINQLYEKYGDRRKVSKLPFKGKLKYYAQYTAMALVMIVILPFLVLYVFYKGVCDDDKKISIKKLFNLKNNVALNVEQ